MNIESERARLHDAYRAAVEAVIEKHPAQAANREWMLARLEGARVVRFRRAVKTKLGRAFEKGEIAIAFKQEFVGSNYVTAWSFANNIGTSVTPICFEVIG